jgi:hypothetical protein
MSNLVFPYEILGEKLALFVTEAYITYGMEALNGKTIPESVNNQNRTINLWGPTEKNWHDLRLDLVLSGTREELEPFFQSSGGLTAVITTNCRATNLRKSIILQRSTANPYAWAGCIQIDHREILGVMKVHATISGRATGRDHRYIAEAEEWTVYFDQAYLPQVSGSLPVNWVDFASDPNYFYLRKYANEPYYLNLELPIPEVYMNKSLIGLPELFPDHGQKGSRRAVQETLCTGMAKSIWLSLFQTALDAVKEGDEGEEPTLPELEWQISVLKQILPKIYSGFSMEAALSAVVQDRKAGDMRRIETLASAVIGKDIVREGKAVRIAVTELETNFGGEQ